MPALLTTTSSRPNVSTAPATAALTCIGSVTSAIVQVAPSPREEAPARSSSATRPTRQTLAPSATSARAVAMPMLPSPPVMTAALPCKRGEATMRPMLASSPPPVLHASARRLTPWVRGAPPSRRQVPSVWQRGKPVAGPVVTRADAVSALEQPAEVRRVRVAPARPDGGHRPRHAPRVAQIVAAVLEAALPDPAGHGGAAGVEELVQLAQRDVVRGRDLGGRQVRLPQVLLDERRDLQHQRPVRDVGIVGRGVHPVGEDRAEQGDDVACQPHANPEARRRLLLEQIGDLDQEREDER